VTLIPGDGVGPEVINGAKLCIQATGVDIKWEEKLLGKDALDKLGALVPEETVDSIKKNKVALKGPVLRPAKTLGSTNSKYKNIDIIVVRENTEDLYSGIEFDIGDELNEFLINRINEKKMGNLSKDTAISLKIISEIGSRRIIRFAFEYALSNNRKKVVCVHKANILKFTDGLFLKNFYNEAPNFPNIIAEDFIVDNLSMQLVLRPNNFDVLVLPNLYGDIISDLCAGLIGGLGLAPGANIGNDLAVFEPVHGSAPKYAGKNKVNPSATILSGSLLLNYLGEKEASSKIDRAVSEVVTENKFVTYDLKPTRDDRTAVGTTQMAEAIAKRIKSY